MAPARYAVWILEIITAWAVLFAVQIPLRKRHRCVINTVVFLIKVLLIPLTALMFVAFVQPLAYKHGDVLTAVYLALVGDVAASAVEFAIRRIRHAGRGKTEKPACLRKLNGALSLIFCLCFFIYGTVNAGNVVEKHLEWQVEGLTAEHSFAFMADIHAGTAQPLETLEEVCRQINEAGPEFVVLGGDITDELTSREDMIAVYRVLSQIDAPVYFVYGNHDRQPDSDYAGGRTYSDEELSATIKGAGITVLADEYVQVADDLILLGREDLVSPQGRKDWSQLVNPYEGTGALIVADHQPYDKEQLAQEVSALQLSGHTHAGQLWPLQLFYRLLGLPAYGEFEQPGTLLYVTAGESGWALPLRTEAHCEWDLISLHP